MATNSANVSAGVLGDFVLAWGAGTEEWLRSLEGFSLISAPGDALHAALSGAAQHGVLPDGSHWLALADLIEGSLDDSGKALSPATPPQRSWRGRFCEVVWNPEQRRAVALTDHFSTLSLYVLSTTDVFIVATDLRLLGRSPWCSKQLDLESIYHFLNFAQIPAPKTIFKGIRRLEPATRLLWQGRAETSEDRYFIPEYAEDLHGNEDILAQELAERIVATVEAYEPRAREDWGCFLSGGTDSSSIVSILARKEGPGRVRSFSIGFAEQGYDELSFARLAAEACGASPSFGTVSREQAQASIERVVGAYDQPFGNASAIPTLACADLAHDKSVSLLVAGDGGDEIFGGNERYAKDRVMETWFSLPRPLKSLGSRVGRVAGTTNVHLLNRVENFFERASLPNPDRFYTDDSFASDHYHELLSPEFRRVVERDASLEFMRSVYRLGQSGAPLHRIMRLDLLMAIAQNDLRKVHGATRAAGISVRFPYLDPALVEYTTRLPERFKVRGLTKRYLFKKAMHDILPKQILAKKKQGFGLPTAVWLRNDEAFKGHVRETLFDSVARARGLWQPAFVEGLLSEHERGAWDHADSIWRLFVLERWLRRYFDAV